MGNAQNLNNLSEQSVAWKKYSKLVETTFHSSFGEIMVYEVQIPQTATYNMMELKKCFQTEQEIHLFLQECQFRKHLSHPNLLQLYNFYSSSQLDALAFCSKQSEFNITYEFHKKTLELELDSRLLSKRYFAEAEILELLSQIVSVSRYLQTNKIYHGDLKPKNIFLTEDLRPKIGDHGLLHPYKNSYFKAQFLNDRTVFLSPVLITQLKNQLQTPSHNHFKSDVWALGVTFLEVCLLDTKLHEKLYDLRDYSLKFDQLQTIFQEVGRFYSPLIVQVLQRMLLVDEGQRPDFLQLNIEQVQQNNARFTNYQQVVKQSQVQPSSFRQTVYTTNFQAQNQGLQIKLPNTMALTQPTPLNQNLAPQAQQYQLQQHPQCPSPQPNQKVTSPFGSAQQYTSVQQYSTIQQDPNSLKNPPQAMQPEHKYPKVLANQHFKNNQQFHPNEQFSINPNVSPLNELDTNQVQEIVYEQPFSTIPQIYQNKQPNQLQFQENYNSGNQRMKDYPQPSNFHRGPSFNPNSNTYFYEQKQQIQALDEKIKQALEQTKQTIAKNAEVSRLKAFDEIN